MLVAGLIDNHDEIAALFGKPFASQSELYGAALERWGDRADDRLIGSFTTITALPDGTMRLSRSPWCNLPLFYARDRTALVAASVPRAIFAAGWPQELREEAIARMLVYRFDHDEATPFAGVSEVPVGTIALVTRESVRLNRWYDPVTAAKLVRFKSDDDYVEAGRAVLDEAARAALRPSRRPGATLSGGLDSPLVAGALARHIAPPGKLRTYTFHPLEEWSGKVPPRFFPDDRPYVREFLKLHPQIEGRFVENRGVSFDSFDERLARAGSSTYGGGSAISAIVYGCYAAAAEDGCDWMFTAYDGNLTISTEASWGLPELFRRGQWRQLWLAARARHADPRPIWRRAVAHGVMPNLPYALRQRVRAWVHRGDPDYGVVSPLVRTDGLVGQMADYPPGEGVCSVTGEVATRAQWLRELYRLSGYNGVNDIATEEVFGLRTRDVTRYRPLIEFFGGVPTEQFLRDGQTRWLGRRMAKGMMPEAQRLNPLHGIHNADWHMRMTPRLPELHARVEAMIDHPLVGPMIDADNARALLDDWPAEAPDDASYGCVWRFDLAGALLITDYVNVMTGRNQ